jgi:hypothetical protein
MFPWRSNNEDEEIVVSTIIAEIFLLIIGVLIDPKMVL